MDLKGKGSVEVNWIRLAQDGDRWRTVVHTVTNRWAI
jgi:hypothetical protein